MLKRGSILASVGILALLAGYVVAFPSRKIAVSRLSSCPMVLAGLTGTSMSLKQTVLDDLDPDDYLVRRYDRPDGTPIWLVIVYFQNARMGAHDPETCYRSAGYRVDRTPAGALSTDLGPVPYLAFRADKGSRHELVRCFWYTAGHQTLSEVGGWRDRMFYQGLKSNRSFGAFIRVSTIEGVDPGRSEAAMNDFMRDLAPHLPEFFPEGRSRVEAAR